MLRPILADMTEEVSTPHAPHYDDVLLYQGDPWRRLATMPRLMADSWRLALAEDGVVSVLRTPFQWVMASPVIEIETGGYMGDVALYVPEVQWEEALAVWQGTDTDTSNPETKNPETSNPDEPTP